MLILSIITFTLIDFNEIPNKCLAKKHVNIVKVLQTKIFDALSNIYICNFQIRSISLIFAKN